MTLRTTCVGSWPIPFGLRPELKRYYAGEIDDRAADDLLAKQSSVLFRTARNFFALRGRWKPARVLLFVATSVYDGVSGRQPT